jgi:quercetin dioxygenase-like cupin family protein
MKYTRFFADDEGESHIEEIDIELELVDAVPPASPALISQRNPAIQYAIVKFPSGWQGAWVTSPTRQIFFILSGKIEVEASDGDKRLFGPGSIVLFEDTKGKGHFSRVVGSEPFTQAWVQLPD